MHVASLSEGLSVRRSVDASLYLFRNQNVRPQVSKSVGPPVKLLLEKNLEEAKQLMSSRNNPIKHENASLASWPSFL